MYSTIAAAVIDWQGLRDTFGPILGLAFAVLCLYWLACMIWLPIVVMGIYQRAVAINRQMAVLISEVQQARGQIRPPPPVVRRAPGA